MMPPGKLWSSESSALTQVWLTAVVLGHRSVWKEDRGKVTWGGVCDGAGPGRYFLPSNSFLFIS